MGCQTISTLFYLRDDISMSWTLHVWSQAKLPQSQESDSQCQRTAMLVNVHALTHRHTGLPGMRDIDAGGHHFAFLLQQGHWSGVGVPANALSVRHPLILHCLGAEGAALTLVTLWSSVTEAVLERDAKSRESVLGQRPVFSSYDEADLGIYHEKHIFWIERCLIL